jgi:two-component system sensor histidine kinase/response regulator
VNQKVAVSLLRRKGHSVTIAETGKQAVDLFRKEAFDLILMDMQMPEMDGMEALVLIRSDETRIEAHIPVIAVTANAMKGDRELYLAAGFDGYVPKPIQANELHGLIGEVMARVKDQGPENTPSLLGVS